MDATGNRPRSPLRLGGRCRPWQPGGVVRLRLLRSLESPQRKQRPGGYLPLDWQGVAPAGGWASAAARPYAICFAHRSPGPRAPLCGLEQREGVAFGGLRRELAATSLELEGDQSQSHYAMSAVGIRKWWKVVH